MNILKKKSTIVLLLQLGITALAICLAFAVCALFIAAAGVSPVAAFGSMIKGVFGSTLGLNQMILKATPLIMIGLGVCVALKGNLTNLGGDGQLIAGAIASIMVGLQLKDKLPIPVIWIIAFICASAAGALWGLAVGAMKAYFNMNVIITAIMINYITDYLLTWAVQGPLKPAESFLPQTENLPKEMHLPSIIGNSRAHIGFIVALIFVFIVYFFLKKHVMGYRIQVIGNSPGAAGYSGISSKNYTLLIMGLSGAFSGAAGMIEMYGVYYRGIAGIANGVGFTAVSAALLCNRNPLVLIITALFFGFISAGANSMQVAQGIPNSVVGITQGVIILLTLLAPFFTKLALNKIEQRSNRKEA